MANWMNAREIQKDLTVNFIGLTSTLRNAGMSFSGIESVLGLRWANGMTAWRMVGNKHGGRLFRDMAGVDLKHLTPVQRGIVRSVIKAAAHIIRAMLNSGMSIEEIKKKLKFHDIGSVRRFLRKIG